MTPETKTIPVNLHKSVLTTTYNFPPELDCFSKRRWLINLCTHILVLSEEHEVLGELELNEPLQEVLLDPGVEDVHHEAGLSQLGLVRRSILQDQ